MSFTPVSHHRLSNQSTSGLFGARYERLERQIARHVHEVMLMPFLTETSQQPVTSVSVLRSTLIWVSNTTLELVFSVWTCKFTFIPALHLADQVIFTCSTISNYHSSRSSTLLPHCRTDLPPCSLLPLIATSSWVDQECELPDEKPRLEESARNTKSSLISELSSACRSTLG
jgi:hypothetical protein